MEIKDYSVADYEAAVARDGMAATWDGIIDYLYEHGQCGIFSVESLGELYESGLAIADKSLKKKNGQYFTPADVAEVMCGWLEGLPGENVCDIGCGTGNLTLAYLRRIGPARARELLMSGRLHLYDIDALAVKVCLLAIRLEYGIDSERYVRVSVGDFMSRDIRLPFDCKSIANPPYAPIEGIDKSRWEYVDVAVESGDLYAAIMAKIVAESRSSVVLTPYSFISGKKFAKLRNLMCVSHSGSIYSFDNVPGTIFCGRKHGIFNSNTSNSVRAAITVSTEAHGGYRVSPLIRFRTDERERLLDTSVLEGFLPAARQVITAENTAFYKCFRELEGLHAALTGLAGGHVFSELVSPGGPYVLSMPNTCRYYTSASEGVMNRNGQITLRFDSEDKFDYAFCLLNSSFAYWHWRMYDGGITYPKGLLMAMPSVFGLMGAGDIAFFHDTRVEMTSRADEFKVTKNNVGVQENVKYPVEYRDRINGRILSAIGFDMDVREFDRVHSNSALG